MCVCVCACVCATVCVCVCFCVRVCMESPHEPIESGWANGAAGPLEPCGGSPQEALEEGRQMACCTS